MKRLAMVLAMAALAGGCAADDRYCTLIGTTEGLILYFDARENALPPGVYTVALDLDGSKVETTFEYIDRFTKKRCFQYCVLSVPAAKPDETFDVDTAALYRHLPTAEVPPAERLYTEFSLNVYRRVGDQPDRGPSHIGVTVTKDDGVVYAVTSFAPAYETREVNGPGCGESHRAMATVVLAAPTDEQP